MCATKTAATDANAYKHVLDAKTYLTRIGVEEDFELVDENGVVQHTLKVSLDADDMVAKINRKYTALVRALSDVQEIKRKEASNEQLSDAVEMLGRAEIDMFEAVFGADGTETIQQFYKDRYMEMAKEIIPFITNCVIPRLAEIKAENKKALVSQYNRAKKRRRFW